MQSDTWLKVNLMHVDDLEGNKFFEPHGCCDLPKERLDPVVITKLPIHCFVFPFSLLGPENSPISKITITKNLHRNKSLR